MDDLTAEQIQFLTYTVLGEARGEGAEGMLAVSNVIRNRADSGAYPSNPVDVVRQRRQFTALDDGQFEAAQREAPVGSALYNTAERIVRGAIVNRTLPDITGRAINYHTAAISPYWSAGATTRWGTTQVGAHIFYARQPVPPLNIPEVLSAIDAGGVAPRPLPRPASRPFSSRGDVRLAEAVQRVNLSRRRAIEQTIPGLGATGGDRGEAALSMTSRLGAGPNFEGSVAAPLLVDYKLAREQLFTEGLGALLDGRVSMTAPNPGRRASVTATASGRTGTRRDVRGEATARRNTATGSADGQAGTRVDASGAVTLERPTELITHKRKTYKVDEYGQPIIEAPKPSPTIRVAAAVASVKSAQALVKAEVSRSKVSASGGAGKTPQISTKGGSVTTSGVTVQGVAGGAAGTMRTAGGAVSARDMKVQPAGSWVPKPAAARMPETKVLTINPAQQKREVLNAAVPDQIQEIMKRSAPAIPTQQEFRTAQVAPVPLPRLKRVTPIGDPPKFGQHPIIPPTTKGDPIDFKKLADGVAAETRKWTGEPPLPRPRPALSPVLPARRPDNAVTPLPAPAPLTFPKKTNLSGVPDQIQERMATKVTPKPKPKPAPVSTATVKPQPTIVGPAAVPARRPETKRPTMTLTITGGNQPRPVAPRVAVPGPVKTSAPVALNPVTNTLASRQTAPYGPGTTFEQRAAAASARESLMNPATETNWAAIEASRR